MINLNTRFTAGENGCHSCLLDIRLEVHEVQAVVRCGFCLLHARPALGGQQLGPAEGAFLMASIRQSHCLLQAQ